MGERNKKENAVEEEEGMKERQRGGRGGWRRQSDKQRESVCACVRAGMRVCVMDSLRCENI